MTFRRVSEEWLERAASPCLATSVSARRSCGPEVAGTNAPEKTSPRPRGRSCGREGIFALLASLTAAACFAQAQPALSPPVQPATGNPIRLAPDFIALPRLPGPVRCKFWLHGHEPGSPPLNTFQLSAFEELLVGSPADDAQAAPIGVLLPTRADNLLVNGQGPDVDFSGTLPVVHQLFGREWEYLAVDATAAYKGRLTRFHRHLLYVRPDLFIIHDDLASASPALFEFLLYAPARLEVDPRSGYLKLERPKAGLTAHLLSPEHRMFRPWSGNEPRPNLSTSTPSWCIHTGPTNKLSELRTLTVMVPHRAGQQRALNFKLLEGQNAIGARIHRDGLPTLVAFHTAGGVGEADLTGLRFTGPLAVDVFRARTRSRQ